MGRGPGKSGLSPHPLAPTKDHKSRRIWERDTLEPPKPTEEPVYCLIRFGEEPGTKSPGFVKNNDYVGGGAGLKRQTDCPKSLGITNLKCSFPKLLRGRLRKQ